MAYLRLTITYMIFVIIYISASCILAINNHIALEPMTSLTFFSKYLYRLLKNALQEYLSIFLDLLHYKNVLQCHMKMYSIVLYCKL